MIDDLDFQIIDKLSQDGRQSSESLASLLKSSSTSIKRRIKQLIDNNIIRVTAVVNPGKVGFKVSALIAVVYCFPVRSAQIDGHMSIPCPFLGEHFIGQKVRPRDKT